MQKPKTTLIMLLIALILGFLFLVSTSYATDTASSNNEIEKIEYGENSKTVYYKDGSHQTNS